MASLPVLATTFSTLAGSGRAGVLDGIGTSATFMLPYGVSIAPDGRVFVSDYLAQRVSTIDMRGQVATLAGGGTVIDGGLKVRGDYADGDGALARFNGPAGIAFDKRGRLFLADSMNRCIRMIDGRHVTTFSGRPNSVRGALDGPIASATFVEPRALAFDRLGNLWVGDAGVGLRKIDRAGIVSRIALPAGIVATHITSIMDLAASDGERLLISDGQSMVDIDLATHAYTYTMPELVGYDALPPEKLLEFEGRSPAGSPFATAMLPGGAIVYTDPALHAVRIRIDQFATSLSRTPAENTSFFGGGFADGTSALVNGPLGIAVLGNRAVIADAGNRRIRLISDIETRHFTEPGINPFGSYGNPDRYYRIAFIGNSYAAWNMPFSQTAAGRIEALLNTHHAEIGLNKEAHAVILRLRSVSAVRDYAKNVLASGIADVVIWEFNGGYPNVYMKRDPFLAPLEDVAQWREPLRLEIRQTRDSLRDAKIPLLIAAHPTPYDFPPIEDIWERTTLAGIAEKPNFPGAEAVFADLFRPEGERFIDLWPAFFADELGPTRSALFSSRDSHMTASGEALVATSVYERFIRMKPWK